MRFEKLVKKRRRQAKQRTASRNALMEGSNSNRKRFGKKQKRKLIIIAVVILALMLAASIATKEYKQKKADEEWKAKQGEIIERDADKVEVDENGNPIVYHKNTEVHVIDCGNGNATLVKKGNYEVLIDAGADVTEYLEKNINGDLEYLILTNNFEGCIKGVQPIYDNFTVIKTIYTNPNEEVKALIGGRPAEEANSQVIDMGENLTVTVKNGLNTENSLDRTSIITIKDNDKVLLVGGQSSADDLTANYEEAYAYIVGGEINLDNLPVRILKLMNPRTIIISTKDKLSADVIELQNKIYCDIYTTYKSKNIVIKMNDKDSYELGLPLDDRIQLEEPATEQPPSDNTEE